MNARNRAFQRALAGLVATSVSFAGVSVVTGVAAPVAIAQEGNSLGPDFPATFKRLPPEKGQGSLEIGDAKKVYTQGDVLELRGTGFATRPEGNDLVLKINAGGVEWEGSDQSKGGNLETRPGGQLIIPATKIVDGAFSEQIVLPKLESKGTYTLNLLGRGDQELGVVHTVMFKGDVASPEAPAAAPAPVGEAIKVATLAGGHRVAPGDVRIDFPDAKAADPKAVAVAVDGTAVAAAKVSHDARANKLVVTLPKGAVLTGEHTVTLTEGENTLAAVRIDVAPGGTINKFGARNADATFKGFGLTPDMRITRIGTAGADWTAGAAAKIAPNEDGSIEITGVQVPNDAELLAAITFDYILNGQTMTGNTGVVVSSDNSPINAEDYETKQISVPAGLYQSAVNAETNEVFAAAAYRAASSTIYKLDGTTLEIKQQITPAVDPSAKPGETKVFAAYGIGLDNKRGLVWVTNTFHGSVAVYKQSDLSLVRQFPNGVIDHPRDVVIDEETGKAYVSAATRGINGGYVSIFDLDNPEANARIELPGFSIPVSLEFHAPTKELFTTSYAAPKAARISLNENNKVDIFELDGKVVDRASGIAYDPETKNIFVANQGTANTVVYNVERREQVKSIPTGAGALNAHFNPVDGRVYISNRSGGTVTVIDSKTLDVVANLPGGAHVNHVSVGANGVVYAVNKASQVNHDDKDQVTRFELKKAQVAKPSAQPSQATPAATAAAAKPNPQKQPSQVVPAPAAQPSQQSDTAAQVPKQPGNEGFLLKFGSFFNVTGNPTQSVFSFFGYGLKLIASVFTGFLGLFGIKL